MSKQGNRYAAEFWSKEGCASSKLLRPRNQGLTLRLNSGPKTAKLRLCLLFIHPRAPNLIGLRSAGTMPA